MSVQPGDLLAISTREERNGLVRAEATALAGGVPDADGVAVAERIDRVERAAYLQSGVEILASATSVDRLRDIVAGQATSIPCHRFRVDVHDPARRLSMSHTDCAIAFAEILPDRPDLRDPLHRFVVIVREDAVIFGAVRAMTDAGYRLHDSKPWTTSSSLDSRFSRGLVNLVPDAGSIYDPCCGAGSIVLEAAALGLEAHGVDWKVPLVGMTRENLAHFEYSGTATQADSRVHEQRADAIVTDLPYGNAIDGDEQVSRSILEQCATLAPRGVFVGPANITPWLEGAGYVVEAIHTAMKRKGFTRWIHVVRSTAA